MERLRNEGKEGLEEDRREGKEMGKNEGGKRRKQAKEMKKVNRKMGGGESDTKENGERVVVKEERREAWTGGGKARSEGKGRREGRREGREAAGGRGG